jgi:hypothetical protein
MKILEVIVTSVWVIGILFLVWDGLRGQIWGWRKHQTSLLMSMTLRVRNFLSGNRVIRLPRKNDGLTAQISGTANHEVKRTDLDRHIEIIAEVGTIIRVHPLFMFMSEHDKEQYIDKMWYEGRA